MPKGTPRPHLPRSRPPGSAVTGLGAGSAPPPDGHCSFYSKMQTRGETDTSCPLGLQACRGYSVQRQDRAAQGRHVTPTLDHVILAEMVWVSREHRKSAVGSRV